IEKTSFSPQSAFKRYVGVTDKKYYIFIDIYTNIIKRIRREVYGMKRSSYMQKLLKNLKGEKEGQKKDSNSSSKQTFSTNLNDNEKAIRELLGYSQDVQFTK